MAERHVYTEAERSMLDAEALRFDSMVGWYEPGRPLAATEESIRRMGLGVDPWNPLWHDGSYARNTRWGAIVAFPTFLGFFGETGILELRAPAECGMQYMIWMGEDHEFQRPLVPGDGVRVYQHRPRILDVTPLDGRGPRTFGLLEGDLEYYDHVGRPLGRLKNYVQRTFQWEPPAVHPMPEYSYTREEIEHLGRLMEQEEVTGAAVRYWEDVRVGDETRPIVTGPTTMASNSLVSAITPDLGDFFRHTRHFFLESLGDQLGPEFIPDPADSRGDRYLIRGGPMGRHYSHLAAQAEGEPCAWLFGVVSRFSLLRAITNWMGDDAELRRFCWRHLTRTRVGDTMVGRGKVVCRRMHDGEHLVDLHVWLRNLRGNVSEAAVATVRLPARETGAGAQHDDPGVATQPATTGADATATGAGFRPGDQVRLKARPDWPLPPGFRFAGAQGTVVKPVRYDEAMADFEDVVICVRIDRAQGEAEPYVGGTLLFRPDDLDRA